VAYSTRTMTAADWKQLRHFSAKEFKRPDRMGYEFMLLVDEVRERAGVKMIVLSSSRTKAENTRAKAAKDSAHLDVICDAIDIKKNPTKTDPNWNRARFKIVKALFELGVVRIGTYLTGSLHFDKTEGRRPADVMWIQV
jgi:hypothetical protein